MDASELKQRLQQRAEDVILNLLPNAQKKGNQMVVGSLSGEDGNSLQISLQKGKEGLFIDRANPEDKGDIFTLWMKVRGCSFKEAIAEAKKFIGVSDVKPAFVSQKPQRPSSEGVAKIYKSPAEKKLVEERKITPDVLEKYRVCYHGKGAVRKDKSGVPQDYLFSRNDHYIVYPYIDSEGDTVFLKSTGIERDQEGKKDIWTTKPYYTLWGWWLVDDNTREVVICEGEEDAMSLAVMGVDMPALSLPSGVQNLKWIDNDYERLQQFETIYLITDSDKSGEDAAVEISKRLGRERCRRIDLGDYKDANEFLVDCGDCDKMLSLFKQGKTYDPPTLQGSSKYERKLENQILTLEREREEPPNFFLDNVPFRFRRGELTLITGFPSHNKALAIDTDIPTPSGLKKIKDVHVGDQVFGSDGSIIKVIDETEIIHDAVCYRIGFSDGATVICDAGHKWLVDTRASLMSAARRKRRGPTKPRGTDQEHKRVKPVVVTTEEMIPLLKTENGTRNNLFVKTCEPVKCRRRVPSGFPAPYTLGVWLGDGRSRSGEIICVESDLEILERICGDGYSYSTQKTGINHTIKGLLPELRNAGLINNKHIPEDYFSCNKKARLNLLRGLMDSDGCCTKGAQCIFASTNERLSNDVRRLVCSLGMKASTIKWEAKIEGRFISDAFYVSFYPDVPVLNLSRKLNRQKEIGPKSMRRSVVSIDPIESVPVKCLSVDSHDNLFLCTDSYIPTHNSGAMYQAMLHEMQKDRRVCIASYEIPAEQMLMNMTWMRLEKFPSAEEAKAELAFFEDRLWFIEPNEEKFYGPETMLNDFLYSIKRFGCEIVVVDALMHVVDKTDFEGQEELAKQLARFAVKNEVSVVMIAHADEKKNGREKIPDQADVLGGQGIAAAAHNGISVWRNMDKENALHRGETIKKEGKRGAPDEYWVDDPDGILYVWKQRLTGTRAWQEFMFNTQTRRVRAYRKI